MIFALAKHNGSVRAAAHALGLPRNTLARHAATLPAWTWAYGPAVLEEHARLLHDSGVFPEVARGVVTRACGNRMPDAAACWCPSGPSTAGVHGARSVTTHRRATVADTGALEAARLDSTPTTEGQPRRADSPGVGHVIPGARPCYEQERA